MSAPNYARSLLFALIALVVLTVLGLALMLFGLVVAAFYFGLLIAGAIFAVCGILRFNDDGRIYWRGRPIERSAKL